MPLITAAQFPGLTPDVGRLGAGFAQGQQIAQRSQQQQLGQQQLQAGQLQQDVATEEARINSVVNAAAELKTIPTTAGKVQFLQNRIADLNNRGVMTDDSQEILGLYQTGREADAEAALDRTIQFGQQKGLLGPTVAQKRLSSRAGIKSFQPVTLINPTTKEKILASPTVDPMTGETDLAAFKVPPGFEVSTETADEKRAADVLAAGLKKIQEAKGKGEEDRAQLNIDRGLEAADSFATVQRSIDLLDSVETGGFDAAQIRAKQLLGIESADEAELSNALGKSVLSQLKATFGAAFTVEEGARLERLEAGIGKSIEGNRRILEQSKKIILRAANRGLRAARKRGDLETVGDIEEALRFRLESEPTPTAQTPAAAPSPAQQAPQVINFEDLP